MSDGFVEPVLVTGAAGFIGSHVAQALLGRGARVIGYDNLDDFYDADAKRSNLAEIDAAASGARAAWKFVHGDVLDGESLASLCTREGVRGVVHLAARAGVRPSIAHPALYARVNVEGTSVVLESARRAGCKRFVIASSSSVYGDNERVPFAETDAVDHPISPYAATKRACELAAHSFHHLTGASVALLRFFTVYGPRQRPDLAIARFIERISQGREIEVYGDGGMSRDFTYIADIVAGVLAAYEKIDAFGYRIWNLGGHHPISVNELIGIIARTIGREARIIHRPEQPGDVQRTYADLTRSTAELGYLPRTPIEEGIRLQWEWFMARAARRGAS